MDVVHDLSVMEFPWDGVESEGLEEMVSGEESTFSPDQLGTPTLEGLASPTYSTSQSMADTEDNAEENAGSSEDHENDTESWAGGSSGYAPLTAEEEVKLKVTKKKCSSGTASSSLSTKLLRKFKKRGHSKDSNMSKDSLSKECCMERTRSKSESLSKNYTEMWLKEILPCWEKKQNSSKVRSLCFKGIPPSVRGKVWLAAIGNEMNITHDLYKILAEQAEASRALYQKDKEQLDNADGDLGGVGGKAEELLLGEISAHKMILLDLPRTYPELDIFKKEHSPYRQNLMEVLEAFVCFRPEVGYAQGMSFVVALLLLNMDAADAFISFVNILSSSCFLDFYKMKMPEVKIYMAVHERFFKEEVPSLFNHFRRIGIEPEMYMVKWVMCLFCQSLPLDVTCRIWDFFVLDGEVAVFRTSIGILKYMAPTFLKMSFEEVAYSLSHLSEAIDEDSLMRSIRSVQNVTNRRLKELLKENREKFQKREESADQSEKS